MVIGRFFLINAITSLVFVIITLMIGKYSSKKKVLKYIPSIVAAFGSISLLIKAFYFSTGFEDIAYMIMAFILAVSFCASLITAVAIDIINRYKSLKK